MLLGHFAVLWHTFAVLALLFGVTTPFMSDLPNRWTFLFGGFGYSAFLSFFVTGLLLLPQHFRTRVFIALFVGVGFSILVPAVILAILLFRLPLSIIHYSTPPLLWVTCAFLAAMFAFACYGWYCRLTRAATKVS